MRPFARVAVLALGYGPAGFPKAETKQVMRTLFRLAFWGILAVLAFVTLSPIGLRPEVGPANLERCVAYALFGVAAALAFPRHRFAILLMVVAVAGILEAGQELSPTRHGRISDFLVKAGSGAAGWLAASVLLAVAMRIPAARARGEG